LGAKIFLQRNQIVSVAPNNRVGVTDTNGGNSVVSAVVFALALLPFLSVFSSAGAVILLLPISRIQSSIGFWISSVACVTHEGMVLADFDLTVFNRLRRKRLIESRAGSPYRISRRGRTSVRAQLDNQGA